MNRNLIRHLAGATMVLLVASTLLAGCDAQQSGEKQMKFVNVDKVLVDSGLAKQEQDYLKAVNESLQKGQQLAEKSYSGLPADKVATARQADKNVLSQQWEAQKRTARNVVGAAMKKATDAYRSDNKIDVIMPTQTVLSIDPELDVSADLIAKLKTTQLDFGKVPEITLKANGPVKE
jgi:Skp family chaperone for outer membrane proteins